MFVLHFPCKHDSVSLFLQLIHVGMTPVQSKGIPFFCSWPSANDSSNLKISEETSGGA